MPCFSFSAPSISPEEECREREELGAKYQQIQDEMHGRETPTQSTSEDFQCSLEDVKAEIAEMPEREKRHFLLAMERAPNLVEAESSHLFYQSNCRSHKEVASRLAAYWKLRYQLFGESKAFLPITPQSHMVVENEPEACSFVRVLKTDRANRPVLFFDLNENIQSKASKDAAMRHLFVALHMLCKEEKARQSGFVVIESLFGFDLYSDFDRPLVKKKMSMLRDCFPIQIKCYHLCAGVGENWVADLVVPVIKQIAGKSIRMRMVFHSANPQEITTILDDGYMIDPGTLPLSIGGSLETNSDTKKFGRRGSMHGSRRAAEPGFKKFSRRSTEPHVKMHYPETELKVSNKLIANPRFVKKRQISNPAITLADELDSQERIRL